RDAFVRLASINSAPHLTIAGCLVAEADARKWFPDALQQRLHVRPQIAIGDMPGVYAEHDIFVFPSLAEGVPLSLLEAMASGMPAVTTDTCGMSDLVEDGYNGLLVKPADAEALVRAVERLTADNDLRVRLGIRACETARRHTWDLVGKKYLSVLEFAVK